MMQWQTGRSISSSARQVLNHPCSPQCACSATKCATTPVQTPADGLRCGRSACTPMHSFPKATVKVFLARRQELSPTRNACEGRVSARPGSPTQRKPSPTSGSSAQTVPLEATPALICALPCARSRFDHGTSGAVHVDANDSARPPHSPEVLPGRRLRQPPPPAVGPAGVQHALIGRVRTGGAGGPGRVRRRRDAWAPLVVSPRELQRRRNARVALGRRRLPVAGEPRGGGDAAVPEGTQRARLLARVGAQRAGRISRRAEPGRARRRRGHRVAGGA